MKTLIQSTLQRFRAPRRRLSAAQVAIEMRAESLLALRVQDGRPQRMQTFACAPQERRHTLERLRKDHWFDGATVQLMLGAAQRQLNSTPRPPVEDAELREALRWQLRDALDYPPEDAVLDVLPVADTEPPGRREVLVFTAKRPDLAQMVSAFTDARIDLKQVATIDCAQRNLAWHWVTESGATALLMPCDSGALCTVSLGEQLILSRAFEVESDLIVGTRRFELAAERMALQMQRSFDLLERRSADAAIANLVVADWGPTAALFLRVAALTAQRVQTVDVQAMFTAAEAGAAASASEQQSAALQDYLHLLGVCFDGAPSPERRSALRTLALADLSAAAADDAQLRTEALGLEADVVEAQLRHAEEPRPPAANDTSLPFEREVAAIEFPGKAQQEQPSMAAAEPPRADDGLVLIDPQRALAEELRSLAAARSSGGAASADAASATAPLAVKPEAPGGPRNQLEILR